MKKPILILFMLFLLVNFCAFGLDTSLLGMRREFFKESQDIKRDMTNSKDIILINSLWDSCIMAISQLDAYLVMIKIFTSIEEDVVTKEAIDAITDWLNSMKKSNRLNIKSLDRVDRVFVESTKKHVRILKTYFVVLNNIIDKELKKFSAMKRILGRRGGIRR